MEEEEGGAEHVLEEVTAEISANRSYSNIVKLAEVKSKKKYTKEDNYLKENMPPTKLKDGTDTRMISGIEEYF